MYRTVVTICTAQWSLYVPLSGHYMYRTVVTVCTAQWSLYAPHSGQCMYRTMVTICTAQRSLYIPPSGYYITAQWSLYVPPVYHSTTLRSAHTLYLSVLCGSQNKQPLFPYTVLTDWFLGTVPKLRKATVSFVMSVRPSAWNNSAFTIRIFVIFYISIFLKSIAKIQV